MRARFAERVAEADWAPHDLVVTLAQDEIAVARPLLAHSPRLTDADLLAVLQGAGVDHRIEVARRPHLPEPVAVGVVEDSEPLVLTALAANDRTTLSPAVMARLVDRADRAAALRGPLARRPELTEPLARRLHDKVGEGLRAQLSHRFPALAAGSPPAPSSALDGDGAGADMERRLVEKLQAAGELRPGFLFKSLRDGRLGLFEETLSALGGVPRAAVARSLHADTPEPLALACAAAGVDRGAFPAILSLVRSRTGGAPGEDAGWPERQRAAFPPPAAAAERLQALVGARG